MIVIAEALPADRKSIHYTSHWAVRWDDLDMFRTIWTVILSVDCQGAHHVYSQADETSLQYSGSV